MLDCIVFHILQNLIFCTENLAAFLVVTTRVDICHSPNDRSLNIICIQYFIAIITSLYIIVTITLIFEC